MIKIAFSDKFLYELPEGHRFPIRKYELIKDQLLYENIINEDQLFDPGIAEKEILLAHDKKYFEKVKSLELSRSEIRTLGIPIHEKSVGRALNSIAGTVHSAISSKKLGAGINIGGGYHHAFADHGEGFCIFNDLAVAARYLIKNKLAENILILDLDVHQGNGTANILANDKEVFTFSMHGQKNYPIRKEKSNLDIMLPDLTRDREYLKILKDSLDTVFKEFIPDFILYQAGVDILESDKLGRLAISLNGCRLRDDFVLKIAKEHKIPISITLGGGYSPAIKDVVDAHVNTIRMAMENFG